MKKEQALDMYGLYYKVPKKFAGEKVASFSVEECLGRIDDYFGKSPKREDSMRFVFQSKDDINDYLRHLEFVEKMKALRLTILSDEGKSFFSRLVRSSDDVGRDAKYAKVRAILDKFVEELSVRDDMTSEDLYEAMSLGQKRSSQLVEKQILRSALSDVCSHFNVEMPVLADHTGIKISVTAFDDDIDIPKKLSSKTAFLVSSQGVADQAYAWTVLKVGIEFDQAVLEGGRLFKKKGKEKWHTQYNYSVVDDLPQNNDKPRSLPTKLVDIGDDQDAFSSNSQVWVAFKSSVAAQTYIEEQRAMMNQSCDRALAVLSGDGESGSEIPAKVLPLDAKRGQTLQ